MLSKHTGAGFKDTSADRLQAIAHALGRADGDFLAALAELQQACGVDKLRLSDYGVKPEDAGELADNAASTWVPVPCRSAHAVPRGNYGHHHRKHLSEYAESGPIGPLFFR